MGKDMPNILVVDDSPLDRLLAGGLLEKDGQWVIDYATNGASALDKLREARFDLVLTDLVMPGMDGLELVAAIRCHHRNVPVILMTSKGTEEIAVRALHAGAASYVPKRLLAQELAETVRRVLAVSSRHLVKARLLGCMTEHSCSFELGNDVALVESLVVYLQDSAIQMQLCDEADVTRIGVALEEAMVNALFHGNLQIGSELRGEDDQAYYALIAQRRNEAPFRDRKIRVGAKLTRGEGVFVIRDEGSGFDPSKLPDPDDPSALERASGRGLLLMRAFMDDVSYDPTGSTVTLVKRCKANASPVTEENR
jgi:CheY-like chemotaxis protein/anti-sigma regulatory factor (Ser/Thr protein kinase)